MGADCGFKCKEQHKADKEQSFAEKVGGIEGITFVEVVARDKNRKQQDRYSGTHRKRNRFSMPFLCESGNKEVNRCDKIQSYTHHNESDFGIRHAVFGRDKTTENG